jgi:hypothetical protein
MILRIIRNIFPWFYNAIPSSFFLFICAYIVWVISPPSPTPSLTLLSSPPSLTPSYLSLPGRNYFALISNFVEERV